MPPLTFRSDDPTRPAVRAVIERHLRFANSISDPEDVHAMDAGKLAQGAVSFFSGSVGDEVVVIGALKELSVDHLELKSMHTIEEARGNGHARAMVRHLLAQARQRGATRVSLETGAMEEMAASRALYKACGFEETGRFGDYPPGRNNVFMTIVLHQVRYPVVLLDLDHCLLDSDRSETLAFEGTMRSVGVAPTDDLFARYQELNAELWAAVERGELSPNDVRHIRFSRFTDTEGIHADPAVMAEEFVVRLGAEGDLYDGAEDALTELARVATLGLVTNGIGSVQRSRIERLGLDRWFSAYVISGEAGVAKPNRAIFDMILIDLGEPDRNDVLMVGDSLTSDIAGGINAGIDTCLFDPQGRHAHPPSTYVIDDLEQLQPIVSG